MSFKVGERNSKPGLKIFDHRFDAKNGILAMVWKDYLTTKEYCLYKKYNNGAKKKTTCTIPQLLSTADFNACMKGMDKLDWLVNNDRIKIRGKKWYFSLFTNLIEVTVVNAHILFCLVNNPIFLLISKDK